ncbi:MAG: hypothetical protein NTV44_04935 [Firmicutes bacterium]|nr:hypothetical protein [Bacillota bacterium]
MKVYFGDTTGINAVSASAADVGAVSAARLAVIDDTTTKFIWAPEADAGYEYLSTGLVTDTAYGVTNHKLNPLTPIGDSDKFWQGSISNYATVAEADAAGNMPCVADLSSVTSANVTFRSWIEGTDPDCINTALSGVYNLKLDLYGIAIA